ncbi:MAG: substrate-binding domain-containing protein [Lentisphaerae bacterium]|nr:substrate-binding domain-containing protein [Lentisphaerota bacterium]
MIKRWGRVAFFVLLLIPAIVVIGIVVVRAPDVVVYCAHDSVYAAAIIQKFETQTGLRVAVKYDTEATKSLGLTELLIYERERPQCDVFWNNELLGTLDLQKQGVLEPYKGSGYARIPEVHKDPDGHWTGFAARMRVYIVNTNLCTASYAAIEERLTAGDLSRVAMARPLYGTTLTHYAVLWRQLGEAGLVAWHDSLRERGLRVLAGNSTVKNQVAAGGCDFGFTDTDDFFMAQDAGAPVALLPVLTPAGQTIVIPNSVSIMAHCPHELAARRFVDYLLSAETELALANSPSRQIPLGPVDRSRLPNEVADLVPAAAKGCSLAGLGESRTACIAWLKEGG